MNDEIRDLRNALTKIGDLAYEALRPSHLQSISEHRPDAEDFAACVPRVVPASMLEKVSRAAIEKNSANDQWTLTAGSPDGDVAPAITLRPSFYWGSNERKLGVTFLDNLSQGLRTKILSHMNAWKCGIKFGESRDGVVRITTGDPRGHWSWIGTQILNVRPGSPTMSLKGFNENTPDSEFFRVVRHETGHTLGFDHEQLLPDFVRRINPAAAYDFYRRTQGWDKPTVDRNVLTPISESDSLHTSPDQLSVMCYQIPGSITFDGRSILGGTDINDKDRTFAQAIYPQSASNAPMAPDAARVYAMSGEEGSAAFSMAAAVETQVDEYLE